MVRSEIDILTRNFMIVNSHCSLLGIIVLLFFKTSVRCILKYLLMKWCGIWDFFQKDTGKIERNWGYRWKKDWPWIDWLCDKYIRVHHTIISTHICLNFPIMNFFFHNKTTMLGEKKINEKKERHIRLNEELRRIARKKNELS